MSSSDKPVDYVRAGALQAVWQRCVGESSRVQAPNPHAEPDHLPPRAKPHNLHSSEDNVTDHKPTDHNMKITKPAARVSEARRSRLSASYIQSLNDRIALLEATATNQLRREAPQFKPRSSQTYPDPEELLAKLKAFQPSSQRNHHTSVPPPSRPTTPTPPKILLQNGLKEVVDAAIERSNELGNPVVALALKTLYGESLHNTDRAQLLNAVLLDETTAEEGLLFRQCISKAKSELKLAKGLAKMPERAKARELAKQAAEAAMDASEMPVFVREVEEGGGMELGAGGFTLSETKVLKVGNGSDGSEWTIVEEKEGNEPWMSVEMSAKEAKGAIGLDGGK